MISTEQKANFHHGFIDALLWSSVDEEDVSIADGGYDLAPITEQRLREYTDAWCDAHGENLKAAACLGRSYAGHGRDLAFTANGHGVGFWDRGLGALGDELTRAAKADYRKPPSGWIVYYLQGLNDASVKRAGELGFLETSLTRPAAIMAAWQHSGQTPPESRGAIFEAYVGDDDLVYVSGFES